LIQALKILSVIQFDLKVGFGLVPSLNMMLEALGLFGGFVSDYAAVYGYKKPDPDEVDV
jgi:hypothetical protein